MAMNRCHYNIFRKKIFKCLLPVDIITILYILITGLYILFNSNVLSGFAGHILFRFGLISFIFLIIETNTKFPNPFLQFIRNFYPLAFLGFFYSETDFYNNIFSANLDPFFCQLEAILFHGQPSIWFYSTFPYKAIVELMNFSYFCYYPLILFLCYWLYRTNKDAFSFGIFIICCSFFLYYFIFILLPVAGPQYFFKAPNNHTPPAYLFSKIMHLINCIGERPTAAFPSSHVGIICIVWYLCAMHAKPLVKIYIPIGTLLIISTVYIKAHYLVDVIGGILSAPILYFISAQLFTLLTKNKTGQSSPAKN